MYRFCARQLVTVAAAGALAAAAAGCGTTALDRATATDAPGSSTVAASPSVHRSAGWSAPPAIPGAEAARLSESFGSGAALRRWGYAEGDFGRNRFRVRDGRLEVVPPASAWADAHRGFFLYRGVRGDFDVRARIRVTGRAGADPTADWSLSGLLVREAPAADGDPENWLSLRTGVVSGRRVLERKSTQGSRSRLALLGARAGWTQLRVVRRGSRFALWARHDGDGGWRRVGSYVRADLPRTLEVGIDAFSGQGGTRSDLRAQVDWVRFAR